VTGLVIVDPTQVYRDWLRDQNVAGISQRVYAGGLPTKTEPTLPAMAITRITSTVRVPFELITYQHDCWAATAPAAAALAAALVTLLLTTGADTILGTVDATAVRFGGVDESTISNAYTFDPDDPNVHRHRVDAQLVLIPQPA
jgi:hypothetical protein